MFYTGIEDAMGWEYRAFPTKWQAEAYALSTDAYLVTFAEDDPIQELIDKAVEKYLSKKKRHIMFEGAGK